MPIVQAQTPISIPPASPPGRIPTDDAKPEDPNLKQVQLIDQQMQVYMKNAAASTSQMIPRIEQLRAAVRNANTTDSNIQILSQIRNKYVVLNDLLEGKPASIKTPNQQFALPAPPSDLPDAVTIYNSLTNLQLQLTNQMTNLMPRVANYSHLIEQAKGAGKDWAEAYYPKKVGLQNALLLGWELYLVPKRETVTTATFKMAYPPMEAYHPVSKSPDLDKWKKTAINVASFNRVYRKEYTFPQILYHFTKDWDMFERSKFKTWYSWNYKKASTNNMKKIAYSADLVSADKLQQFTNRRKKLMNRINLVEKALYDLINNSLIAQKDSNKLYKIIAMLKMEAMQLQAPKLAAARVRRAGRMLSKFGFAEGRDLLFAAATDLLNPEPITKTAADEEKKPTNPQDAVELLKQIKKEMDSLNYSRHLDSLYSIKKRLESMGRNGDMESVEKIIRDDLSTLEKLNKKLIEVYTNLSKVPLELSEIEDKKMDQNAPKAVEMPLEVSEEEIGKPKIETKTPTPKAPIAPVRTTAPVRPAAPAIERNIPNV